MPPKTKGRRVAVPTASRSGAQSTQAPTPGHITTVGVRRPGEGRSGSTIPINVNSFIVKMAPPDNVEESSDTVAATSETVKVPTPDIFVWHYDVAFSDERNLGVGMNRDLIQQLKSQVAPAIFAGSWAVFDGRKNLYAVSELNLGATDSREFDVILPGMQPNPQLPPRVYKVKLTRVNKINLEILDRFCQGVQAHDNSVTTALQALNIALREEPSQRFPNRGRSFYTQEGSQPIGGGLVLWRGYFQSVRPARYGLLINVDIATGVMYQSGHLIDLCRAFLGVPVSQLSGNLDPRMKRALSVFLFGVRVRCTNAAGGTRTYSIRRLGPPANQVTFTLQGGVTTTVANYFQQINNHPLSYPHLLCVEVGGRGAMIPLELCTVLPGQLMRKEFPKDKRDALVKFSTMPPKVRLASVRKGFEELRIGTSAHAHNFGLSIEMTAPLAPAQPVPRLVSTEARVLKAPRLYYNPKTKNPTAVPKFGSWNMVDKQFYDAKVIAAWVLVSFEPPNRFNQRYVDDIAKGFVSACRRAGMTVTDADPTVKYLNGQGNITRDLVAAGDQCYADKKKKPTVFVAVLPDSAGHIYHTVKHWGDITMGIPTQCLKATNCVHAKENFWFNVALKVNVKLGGKNVIVDPANTSGILSEPRTPAIIMGADVTHPAPGSTTRPSYAAVVASVSLDAAKYVATQSIQTSRQELIDDLKEMTVHLLKEHMSYREHIDKVPPAERAPKRLIFYRDGVSESQFQQVKDMEIPRIQAACRELKINPKITFIVVGKRHHIRFFPAVDRDADRSGNCPAGTILDKDITHPTEFDYYLQSHGGIQGTSRPGHYSVLHDDNNFPPDSLQALDFALCHVYAAATRSVSIPAPVYYAHVVCDRLKLHFDPATSGSSEADSGSVDEADVLAAFKRDWKPVHPNQAKKMWFS
ncbi:argonaute-like protein [Roridomyces roridus]|uniref:Argonaute-like protein n=1 Tax=Roridomyces roridus TaxID=1738132 RepID=A0AAD7FML1_9AGAR|nr:argonaute-like protein [Roridomyces roridus]